MCLTMAYCESTEPSTRASESVQWHLVVPVRHADRSKTRFSPHLGGGRALLARAMALDTLQAAVHSRECRVCVVTDDPVVAAWARDEGVMVVSDPGNGLNAAVRAGFRSAEHRWRAALLADLPALRSHDLDAALLRASSGAPRAGGESFVPDLQGSGTVLRCGPRAEPAFGGGSAARHTALGAQRLDLDLPHLRCDVDDPQSLERARALGVGAHTHAALAALGLG